MNKQLKKATTFIGIIAMVFLYTACEDDPIQPPPPPGGGGGDGGTTNKNLIDYNIDSKTTLKNHLTGVDYQICGRINVNAELIIEPGVEIVMCAGARISVGKDGSLNAVGTDANPIVFKGKTPSKGYWDAMDFNSNNPANVLDHVIISDGGGSGTYYNSSVWVNDNSSAQLTFKNSTIKNSKGFGFYVENGASIPNFTNNTFSNNGDYPVKIPMSIIGSLDDSSNYGDGNSKNMVYIYSANINQPQVVKNINVPYLLDGRSYINSDLKLNPGVEFQMSSGARIDVDAAGSMNAIGTSSDSIVIKGKVNAVGYWDAIDINSNNPLNEFEYVTIKNGGKSNTFYYSSIWVNDNNNGSFKMTNCTITDSYAWGLYVEGIASMTPSTAAAIESANSFSNNGTGTSASCTGNCNVYIK